MYLILLSISSVCINEVMSNPLGGSGSGSPEDRNEFIEIFNFGPDTVDLYNWKITDFDAVDNLIPFVTLSGNSSTIVPPGGFALIMDPEYVDSGKNYLPYGIPNCVLLRPGNTTIGNGLSNNDYLALLNQSGDTVSTYYHPLNSEDGISVERISPSIGDLPENWGLSQDSTGSTPGRINSIYAPPDFSLDSLWVEEPVVHLLVKNSLDKMLSGFVRIFNDKNRNRERDSGELIKTFSLSKIPKDSVVHIDFSLENEGVHLIGFEFLSKIIFRRIRIGGGISNLIINEVMFAPSGPPEWIEFFNRSPYDYYLDSCWIEEELLSMKFQISSRSYLVIADNSSSFFAYYVNIPSPLLSANLSFSNNGDTISLFDENGFLIDRCIYKGTDAERNHSIERVSPDIGSDNPSNWGESIEEGGTPGGCNSIYAEYRPEELTLAITPRHFTPDGDGVDEVCVISFSLPYNRNDVTIRIYDRGGHLLKEKSSYYGGDRGEWVWDGRDYGGNKVPTGLYIVFLLIKDLDNVSSLVKKAVVSVGN